MVYDGSVAETPQDFQNYLLPVFQFVGRENEPVPTSLDSITPLNIGFLQAGRCYWICSHLVLLG